MTPFYDYTYPSGVETNKVPKDTNHNNFWKEGGLVKSQGEAVLQPIFTILARRTGLGLVRWTPYEVTVQKEPSCL